MPRRRAKLEPEALPFVKRDFLTCVRALDTAQGEVEGSKEVMDAAKEAAAAMGFDVKLMDGIRKLKNRVEDGKITIQAAQARIENTRIYAEAVGLMDQQDLFREGTLTAEDANLDAQLMATVVGLKRRVARLEERMTLDEFHAQFPDLFGQNLTKLHKTNRKRASIPRPRVTSLEQLLVPRSVGRLKLDPEQVLSSSLYNALLAEWSAGRLRCVFTCVSNEHRAPVYNAETAFEASAAQIKKLAMGCVPGFPDWVFLWAGGGLMAELKIPGGDKVMTLVQRVGGAKLHPTKRQPGKLSDVQLVMRDWCRQLNVPHTVWYSVEEAVDELRAVGALAR